MINKHYFIGTDEEIYLIGIARKVEGEETQRFDADAPIERNGVLSPLTSRVLGNVSEVKGYLIAVVGEFAFEGPNKQSKPFFNARFHHWNNLAEDIFDKYLQGLPFYKHLTPLKIQEIKELEKIIGLHFED